MEPTILIPELVCAALQGRRIAPRPEMTAVDWNAVLHICAAQRVHTFLYDALPESGVDGEVLAAWQSQVRLNERASGLVAAIVRAQEEAWRKRGLNYALVKGPTVAALYPVPGHRCCGDLDWWFGEKSDWDAALEPAGRNAEEGVHRDSDGDIFYLFRGVCIEHHRDWTQLSSRRLRRIAGAPAVTDGRLGPEDTLLMLMCHILHHVAWKGVTLKQITDLAVALVRYDGAYDRKRFAERLGALGLTRWAAFLAAVVPELTGIGASCFPVEAQTVGKDRDRFLSILFGQAPQLPKRIALMWRYSKVECVARYLYLIVGKIWRY